MRSIEAPAARAPDHATGYRSPLREAQAATTRARILDAMTAVIEAGDDPTYAAIAERAGVRERTVYRHFRTRDDLYAAFWDHIHQSRFGVGFDAQDLRSLQALVHDNFAGFERNSALVHVMLHSKQGLAMRLAPNAGRRQMFEQVVDAELSELDPVARRRFAAAAQVLYSAMSWEYLREYWEMDADEASATVQLALTALFSNARTAQPSPERT